MSVFIKRMICLIVAVLLFLTSIDAGHAAELWTGAVLPEPGVLIGPSEMYTPSLLKGMSLHSDNPFRFDFLVEPGSLQAVDPAFEAESRKLVKYFLSSLTVPQDQLWVNLSPYEGDRIVAQDFGVTEMGRDMLAQDYLLKQFTASLTHPEKGLGKEFWNRLRVKAQQLYGVTDVPWENINKVWIVPEQATVYVHKNSVFVVRSHLKVMTGKDYLAEAYGLIQGQGNGAGQKKEDIQEHGDFSDIVRELLIPEIEKEVNQGRNFSQLRQIYHAMILAVWYKKHLRTTLLGQLYADKNKVRGVDLSDHAVKDQIYDQYLQAFRKGVFNYIREEHDPATDEMVPRKYFSGGIVPVTDVEEKSDFAALDRQEIAGLPTPNAQVVGVDLEGIPKGDGVQNRILDGVNGHGPAIKKVYYETIKNEIRSCFLEMDPAYDIVNILNQRKDTPQKLLLVGVGRGVGATELAILFPNIEIVAVNKEAELWDEGTAGDILRDAGYATSAIDDARRRITVLDMDILDKEARELKLHGRSFDLVFFEPRVQVYFPEKVGPIESLFNDFVKPEGLYGFVSNSIFTSEQAFNASDFESPLYERQPDPDAVELIKRSFSVAADLVGEHKLGGNLYLTFKKTSSQKVRIPLEYQRNEVLVTPTGLTLTWSIYQPTDKAQRRDPAILTEIEHQKGRIMREEPLLRHLTARLDHASHGVLNPIMIIAGSPGAGKTTLSARFKAHLQHGGIDAVTVNTDKFFKLDHLFLKQAFLIAWLKLPFVSSSAKEKIFNALLMDAAKVESFRKQVAGVDYKKQAVAEVRVDGLDPFTLRVGTLILLEGSLAQWFFGARLPVAMRAFMGVPTDIQQQRIMDRGINGRGYSRPRARLNAMMLASPMFAQIFERDLIGAYDELILSVSDGMFQVFDLHPGMDAAMKPVMVALPIDEMGSIAGNKFEIRLDKASPGTLPLLSQLLGESMMLSGNLGLPVNVALGYDGSDEARDAVMKMGNIMAANGLIVDVLQQPAEAYHLADMTRMDMSPRERHAYAYHVCYRDGLIVIKSYSKGILSVFKSMDIVGELDSIVDSYQSGNSRSRKPACLQYKRMKDIPETRLKYVSYTEDMRKRFDVFDVEALNAKAAQFAQAMRSKGLVGIDALRISNPEAGLKDFPAGQLDLGFNDHGPRTFIRDVGDRHIDSEELALIFAHYLHSIGENGDFVRTRGTSGRFDRIVHEMGVELIVDGIGVATFLQYPDAMVAVNKTGYIHFTYKGSHYASNPVAELLLTLEIMTATGLTLGEYLDKITREVLPTTDAEADIKPTSLLLDGTKVFQAPFEDVRHAFQDPVAFGNNWMLDMVQVLGLYDDIFVLKGEVSTDSRPGHIIIIFHASEGQTLTVNAHISTTAKDTLRLSTESSMNSFAADSVLQSAVMSLARYTFPRYLINNTLSRMFSTEWSSGGFGNGSSDAAEAYGGINLNAGLLDLKEEGNASQIENTLSRAEFLQQRIDGLIPRIRFIHPVKYLPELVGMPH